ncbi:c-type cytochrome biogenesis protein CcmI [Xanthobacteraceae bacterium Astr-EGSB]|uniref:c-type cytochrome biogenesis protein CcmI n=1 Tax=Astrobacterium formosum TaxID=3069710 RepID=UPI0027AF793D|nr:c-type cytochrome biogenesis protein CcmI [Xanthobacteraceae bacterium Astr-EGSB]
MTLWLLLAFMTAMAVAAILWPLARRPKPVAAGNDVAVYRDQLEEIERDRANGAIGAPEAEAARIEVSRRLLAAADATAAESAAAQPAGYRRLAGILALILVPVGASALYLQLGSPELPGQPLSDRLARVHAGVPMQGNPQGNPQGQSLEALIARVEAYLEKNPDDGRGWEVIAPVYMRSGNYEAAAKARGHALRLLGSTAEREADFGETVVAAANGVVTAEAHAAFDRAIKLDAKNVSARFYLGLAAEQDGRKADAVAAWTALLADATPEAGWTEFVRRSIARAEGRPEGEVAKSEPQRSTTADVAKALGMAPEAPAAAAPAPQAKAGEDDMIRGMVSRLADRLKQDGSDVDGWIRLVRSYVVLGDADKARAAITDARTALGKDSEKLRRLDDGVKELGLEG